MYRPILMSMPLIAMLTACGGSDSDDIPDSKQGQKNTITFSGTVYDGPMADTTVSIYAGKTLLASGVTNQDGQYSVTASISVADFENIKTQQITYHAQRNDIILYQFAGSSLAEALEKKTNQTLITNFSTVEYVLADIDKNNFVTDTEWKAYQQLDRSKIEPKVIRFGVGLKSIIDFSATLAGFENSTVWLRALDDDTAWQEWYRLNIVSYADAWDALFADKWFLDQEANRFDDITEWEPKYDNIVIPGPAEPVEPVVDNVIIAGIPQRVSVGDLLSPSTFALWSNASSTDVSDDANITFNPADALVKNGDKWEVKTTGTISFNAKYQGTSANITFVAEVAETALENIVLTGIGQRVTVGDKLQPLVSALWSDDSTTDVTSLVKWSYNPTDAVKLNEGQLQVIKPISITLIAEYQGATATVNFNADKAVLTSMRLGFDRRQQYLGDELQVAAQGVHQNGYVVDFSGEATWTSSNPDILESLGNGRFLTTRVGTATVTATLGDLSATQEFDVEAKMVNVSLNLPNGTISRAETLQLSLNGEFNDGSVKVITDDVIWTSSNPEFLTIDEHGVATGIKEGQSVVTATYQSFTLEKTVTVIQPKIIASTPRFIDGVMTLREGDNLEYGFTFTRSNGVEHLFNAAENGLDFESYGFRRDTDVSGIDIADLDKDKDRIRAVRAGETKLSIEDVPVELQQIFVEIGAITSANDYPSKVTLNVNVLDNANVYQWNALEGNAPIGDTVTLVQGIVSNNKLYRFWQVSGGDQAGIHVTQLTAQGESAAIPVLAGHTLVSNQIISDSFGYVLLVTTNANNDEVNYRYNLSDGSLEPVTMTGFPNSKFNFTYDSFAFTPGGDLVVGHLDKGVTPYIYSFDTKSWEHKTPMPGVRIQTPSNKTQIAVLDTEGMNSNTYKPPVLSIFDLDTQTVTAQEFVVPGDAEYFCRSTETLGIAVADAMKNSGAGCLVSKIGSYDGIGYWLWDSIATLPKLHLFTDGVVKSTSKVFAVASRKLDGHTLFSAARVVDGNKNDLLELAEIVDVESDGNTEQKVKHQRFAKQGKTLEGYYSKEARIHDGTQFTVDNVDVPNELIAVFNQGVAVRDENGHWSSDKFMYQLPVPVDTDWKLYDLGNSIVLSEEGSANTKYWLLQMRKPNVMDQPVETIPPVDPEQPAEPVPDQ